MLKLVIQARELGFESVLRRHFIFSVGRFQILHLHFEFDPRVWTEILKVIL